MDTMASNMLGMDTMDEIQEKNKFFEKLKMEASSTIDFEKLNESIDRDTGESGVEVVGLQAYNSPYPDSSVNSEEDHSKISNDRSVPNPNASNTLGETVDIIGLQPYIPPYEDSSDSELEQNSGPGFNPESEKTDTNEDTCVEVVPAAEKSAKPSSMLNLITNVSLMESLEPMNKPVVSDTKPLPILIESRTEKADGMVSPPPEILTEDISAEK